MIRYVASFFVFVACLQLGIACQEDGPGSTPETGEIEASLTGDMTDVSTVRVYLWPKTIIIDKICELDGGTEDGQGEADGEGSGTVDCDEEHKLE